MSNDLLPLAEVKAMRERWSSWAEVALASKEAHDTITALLDRLEAAEEVCDWVGVLLTVPVGIPRELEHAWLDWVKEHRPEEEGASLRFLNERRGIKRA